MRLIFNAVAALVALLVFLFPDEWDTRPLGPDSSGAAAAAQPGCDDGAAKDKHDMPEDGIVLVELKLLAAS